MQGSQDNCEIHDCACYRSKSPIHPCRIGLSLSISFIMLRIGIDLGGTKIELVALDESGRMLLRRRRATPQGDYQKTIEAVAEMVEAVENERAQRDSRVGLGIPGAESALDGRIKNANSTCLIGEPLKDDLQALLGREVRVANDANCFALSEAVDGAG